MSSPVRAPWWEQCHEPPTHCQDRRGMKGHALSTSHAICIPTGATIGNGVALASRGQDPKRSGATYAMCASLGVFVTPTTSSSMTARPIPAYGWRTTASCAGQVGQTMASSSSNSSPSTWPRRRAWHDHLPRNTIDCWEDLKEIFTGNFQGTYVRPGNPWDLNGCRQMQGESL
jgi:hypothetical protein